MMNEGTVAAYVILIVIAATCLCVVCIIAAVCAITIIDHHYDGRARVEIAKAMKGDTNDDQ